MAVSDILGDEHYYFLISNPADNTSEFLTSFNVAVTHVNRRHRINYGWGAFHLFDERFNLVEGLVRERQAARDAKDWAAADALREKIRAAGYVVEDRKEGPLIKQTLGRVMAKPRKG